MKRVQLEHLRPGEIIEEKKKKSIIYIPFGPIEWHNPANPYGTDAFIAYELACKAAERTGGVVFPVCCMGSDCARPKEHLEKLGFDDTNQYIVGMDFPNNMMRSFYFPVEIVSLVIKEHVKLCVQHEYKLIVVLSAHGAATQNILIDEMCKDFTSNTASTVINGLDEVLFSKKPEGETGNTIIGHANVSETSMMCYLRGNDVDLSALPEDRNTRLRYQDYGIVDRSVLFGGKKGDGFVVNDPRDATKKLGEELINNMVEKVTRNVSLVYERIDME